MVSHPARTVFVDRPGVAEQRVIFEPAQPTIRHSKTETFSWLGR